MPGCLESKIDISPPIASNSNGQIAQTDMTDYLPPIPEPAEEIDEFFPIWVGSVDNNRIVIHEEYGDPNGVVSSRATPYTMFYHHVPKRGYVTKFLFAMNRAQPKPAKEDYVRKVVIEYNPVIIYLENEANNQTSEVPMATVDEVISDEFLNRKPKYIAGKVGPHEHNRYMLVPIWEINKDYYLIAQIFIPHYHAWLEKTEYDVETGRQTKVRKVNISDDDGIYRFGDCLVHCYFQFRKDDFWNYGNSKRITSFLIEE